MSNGIRRIFQEMTGAGLMRRNPHAAGGNRSSPTPPEQRSGASLGAPAWLSARRSRRRSGLDIPTFLRRQSN